MNILMAASEMTPFAQTGALADSVAELAAGLKSLGHEVTVVLPYYRQIREGKMGKPKKTSVKFSVNVGPSRYPCEIYEAKAAGGVRVFLVGRDEYFDRSGLYGMDGRDYQDNAARFIFFTKCVLELSRRMDPTPHVLHSHGWPAALAPVFARDQQLPFRTVLTPHGLDFQGNFWSYDFGLTNLSGDYFSARGVEYFGSMNFLKGGILFADAVVLPGERFVAASQTSEHGCGLDPVLREHPYKLVGIPAAEDVQGWQPEGFSATKPEGRAKSQAPFLQAMGLDAGSPRATFVCFTDASERNGIEALLGSLDRLLVDDVRVALLGPVRDSQYVALEVARRKHRGRFAQVDQFDETLARQALAGADFQIVAGPAEPHASWLKRGLLFGAVPIALQCRGLFQIVRDWEDDLGEGFVFSNPAADGLLDACRRAMHVTRDAGALAILRQRGLSRDFSTSSVARQHVALYERMVEPAARAA